MAKKTLGDICCDRLWEMLPYAGLNADNYDDHEVAKAWEAAASAVWDQAVEACASAIKEVEKELAAEGEVYILLKTAEALRSLKRSDKTESDNAK